MATMKKAAVKGFKETKGIRNSENKTTADDARRANAYELTKPKAKRPTGELPKRISGYAMAIKQGSPKMSSSSAAAQAGKIRDEFATRNKAAAAKMKKDAASKKAAFAKKAK